MRIAISLRLAASSLRIGLVFLICRSNQWVARNSTMSRRRAPAFRHGERYAAYRYLLANERRSCMIPLMMLGYKSNNSVVYSSKYHVIWCPKYRRKVLVGDIATRHEEIMRIPALKYRAEISTLEIWPDQVHRPEGAFEPAARLSTWSQHMGIICSNSSR